MRYARMLAAVAVLASVVLMSSDGVLSQDKEKKAKGQVPQGWGKLMLTAAQKEKIYEIQTKYKEDVKKLKDQIAALEAKERTELIGVLTEEQKKILREGLDPKEKSKDPKDKAKEKN